MSVEKMFHRGRERQRHRHGGKRIPNFVRPEEQSERVRRTVKMFDSVQALFASSRRKR